MLAASRESGRVLAEGFMYRHHPQTMIVGEWVRSGCLGEITQVWGVFNFQIGARDDVRMIPEYGGGSLWDVGVYPMSFAQYVYGGPPVEVTGLQWVGDTGVDETFVGQMRYPGGGLAQIASSFRNPFNIQMEIIGREGRLSLNRPFTAVDDNRRLLFYNKDNQVEEIPVPEQELYIGEVEDMHAAILDGAPQYLTLQETRDHVRTILALYESARIGKPVSL
jgi:predicted dehydrogenase